MSTLLELRIKHKVNKPIGYVETYQEKFEKLRDKEMRILEIGLLTGGPEHGEQRLHRHVDDAPSMKMWAEYFTNGDVWGADICDFSHVAKENNFNFVKTDQSHKDKLLEIPKSVCKLKQTYDDELFDIIIDDGSHASFHQQNTFFNLFPYLKKGGFYIIEDLQWKPHWDPTRKRAKSFVGEAPDMPTTIHTNNVLATMQIITVVNNSNDISDRKKEEMRLNLLTLNNYFDTTVFPFGEEIKVNSREIKKLVIHRMLDFKTPLGSPYPYLVNTPIINTPQLVTPDNRFTLCVIEKK